MQISAANLLASQSQAVRPRTNAAQFEPIAFRQTPAASPSEPASTVEPAVQNKTSAAPSAPAPAAEAAASIPGRSGYVRPGSHIDIKI